MSAMTLDKRIRRAPPAEQAAKDGRSLAHKCIHEMDLLRAFRRILYADVQLVFGMALRGDFRLFEPVDIDDGAQTAALDRKHGSSFPVSNFDAGRCAP